MNLWRTAVAALAVVGGFEASAFEKIAYVDGSDFAEIVDSETREGTEKIIDHVLLTGADTILWRTHSGAMPRYRSRCEDPDGLDAPFNPRRLPTTSKIHNWLRLWKDGIDPLSWVFDACANRPQVRAVGFHSLLEEAHWQFVYLGQWNLAHPQYLCRKHDGTVQMYHASFAFPEVVGHRLAIVSELLDRKPSVFFLDIFRDGGWSVCKEYTRPNLEEWARRHPGTPPPSEMSDPLWTEWTEVASRGFLDYLKGVRALTRQTGARFLIGIDEVNDGEPGREFPRMGLDWRRLADEGLVDGLAVGSVTADETDPFGSTERRFRRVAERVRGRCKVYFPILNYNFSHDRPSYWQLAKWAKVGEAEAVRRLLGIAARCEADGIVLECVDWGNYSPEVCEAIRSFNPEKREGE